MVLEKYEFGCRNPFGPPEERQLKPRSQPIIPTSRENNRKEEKEKNSEIIFKSPAPSSQPEITFVFYTYVCRHLSQESKIDIDKPARASAAPS